MREYYDLEQEFPLEQVFHRLRPEKQQDQSEANMGKARNIFFVTRFFEQFCTRSNFSQGFYMMF